MKTLIFISLFLLSCSSDDNSNDDNTEVITKGGVYTGVKEINSIDEYNDFIAREYTSVEGTLHISKVEGLTDLKGLESITSIIGRLTISENGSVALFEI